MKSVRELLGDKYTPEMAAAFPDVDPGLSPFGYLTLVQLRMPRDKIGSIVIPDTEVDVERYRTQAALVRGLGVACFKDRQTGADWVEGPWYREGDFLRVPMFGGDRFNVTVETPVREGSSLKMKRDVTFIFIKDADAIAKVLGDPLKMGVS